MAYTPTVWQAGDTVTAAKLNKMEQGIASGGGIFVVNAVVSEDTNRLDKTAAEVWAAVQTSVVMLRTVVQNATCFVPLSHSSYTSEPSYVFKFGDMSYSAYSDNDYPTAYQPK